MYYYSFDSKTEYLALGAVKNISLNITISNKGDDAYDTNVYFNFSKELYFIKMWQEVSEAVYVVIVFFFYIVPISCASLYCLEKL